MVTVWRSVEDLPEVVKRYACDLCHAHKGELCRSVNVRDPGRYGQVIRRPHHSRTAPMRRARQIRERDLEWRKARIREQQVPAATADRIRAWRSLQEFDRLEEAELALWLTAYGSVLWDPMTAHED